MNEPKHAQRIMSALAERLRPAAQAATRTPFGVTLQPACGLFHLDERVSAPGVDACTPRVLCEVAGVGTRLDYPGVWYLLRGPGPNGALSLVRESDLRRPHASRATPSGPLRTAHPMVFSAVGLPPRRERPTRASDVA